MNPAGTRVYVANVSSNTVSVIDTASNSVIATVAVTSPVSVAVNPAGTRVYVANQIEQHVSVIDTASNTVDSDGGGRSPTLWRGGESGRDARVCDEFCWSKRLGDRYRKQ